MVALTAIVLLGCPNPATTGSEPDTVINIAAITGVTAPIIGATPVTTITETAQYTGIVAWNGSPETFVADTVYTATITLTAKTGYTTTGVAENFFTVAEATATNAGNSGVITAVFPATGTAPDTIRLIGLQPDHDTALLAAQFLAGSLGLSSGTAVLDTALDSTTKTTVDVVAEVAADRYAIAVLPLLEFQNFSQTIQDSVLALKIDGFDATTANVRSSTYPFSRTLSLAYMTPQSSFASDFIEYTVSASGQTFLTDQFFIGLEFPGTYLKDATLTGSFAIGGSSTVGTFADSLINGYETARGDFLVNGSYTSMGSTAGSNSLKDGSLALAGFSRDLKANEISDGLTAIPIGYEAFIALVHPDNPLTVKDLTKLQLLEVLNDTRNSWNELNPGN